MAQSEIYKFLVKNKNKKYRLEDFLFYLNISRSSISLSLKRMVKNNDIKHEQILEEREFINRFGNIQRQKFRKTLYWVE